MAEQAKIYYIYDALCGWCYGFSPVIEEFHQKYRDDFEFNVLSGGMVTGEREGPIGEVAGYISEAYKEVEKTTGVRFGEEFLENTLAEGSAWFSSVPPALAMALFRTQNPQQAVEFAVRIQKAIYRDGMPPAELSTYGECAAEFGLDAELFQRKMEDPMVQKLITEEFRTVAGWNINGFPSMVYMQGKHAYMIARGYTPLNILEQTLRNVQAEIASAR